MASSCHQLLDIIGYCIQHARYYGGDYIHKCLKTLLQRNATKRRALPLRTSVPCSMMESKLGKRFFSSVNVTRCLPKLVNTCCSLALPLTKDEAISFNESFSTTV
ncbi:unnamed protein product [Arabidopsis thaliana]|uniref:Uncharacterized protein n=1 Tax=Arabidopsis thaliana TaxID=3702 RepID=A0A5S9Y5L6_ARATH|nr:unnamed protein product [Arabidopsis thaliana]VYS67258.1 unnamed protein product [Arabidopsis thaliana]